MNYPSANITLYRSPSPWRAEDDRFLYELGFTEQSDDKMLSYYDFNYKIIVCARDSKIARKLAQTKIMDERKVHPTFWEHSGMSYCKKIGLARKPNGKSPARERVVCAEGHSHG